MSQHDRRRWDKKWSDTAAETFKPNPLLLRYHSWLEGGEALDLACGKGQNSIWLAEQGYRVLGVDISRVGLNLAQIEAGKRELSEQIHFKLVDLDSWRLPFEAFDLICVFRFLDRRLFSSIRSALRPDGLLFYGTRHVGFLERQPEASEEFLLQFGELKAEFGNWQILHYVEDSVEAKLIARK